MQLHVLILFGMTAISSERLDVTQFKQVIILLILLIGVNVIAQDVPSDFDVQGHRGARGLAPENTLPAFEIALDLGVTTLELDMHFTADNRVVIWHDEVIEYEKCRLPEGVTEESLGIENDSLIFSNNPRRISNLTLEQVQAFICDINPDENRFPTQSNEATLLAGDNYQIQTLEALFEFVQDYANSEEKTDEQRSNASDVQFNIETKRQANNPRAIGDDFDGENAGAFELAILDIIYDYDMLERVTIQSFDHRSIWAVRAVEPDIRIAALTNHGRVELALYAEQGAQIWSPNYSTLTQDLLDEAHELGLLVIPWTVNDAEAMQSIMDMGVDGIITDYPDILIRLVAENE